MAELWDLYDENRRRLGKTHERGKPIPAGCYHIVAEIWAVNSRGEVLLTLRDPNKESYPNLWENTGGSALAGESSLVCAVRELREETGINAEESELILLGTIWGTSAIVDSYALRKDVSLDDLRMQEGETCAAQWVTLEKLNSMNTQGLIADPVGFRLKPLYDHFFRFVQG